jgi:hypothetical protein
MRVGPPRVVCCGQCGAAWSRARLLSGNTFGGRVWTDGFVDAPMYPVQMTIPFFRCATCRTFTWDAGDTELEGVRATRDVMTLGADDLFDAIDARIWRSDDEARSVRRLAWWFANDARRSPPSASGGGYGCLLSIACAVMLVGAVGRGPLTTEYARGFAAMCGVLFVVGLVWARYDERRAIAREADSIEREIGDGPLTTSAYRDDPTKPPADLDPRLFANLVALDVLLDANAPESRLEQAEVARELGRFERATSLLDGIEWQPEFAPTVSWLRRLIARRDHRVRRVLTTKAWRG